MESGTESGKGPLKGQTQLIIGGRSPLKEALKSLKEKRHLSLIVRLSLYEPNSDARPLLRRQRSLSQEALPPFDVGRGRGHGRVLRHWFGHGRPRASLPPFSAHEDEPPPQLSPSN